ncbi:sensor histidine kinase [Emcibacter sp.]|uniref:sensor histidine kinase n=1 Tax=Emcibacter sp. TaxID=1979954 RepID=UPI002AA631B1|nr:ATP-binding protein [Emcibacter sp.]
MRPLPSKSLSFRLAKIGVFLAFLVGILLSGIQVYLDYLDEDKYLEKRMGDILQVAEKPAARAVYIIDQALAGHLLEGLFAYEFVQEATITDDLGQILATRSRPIGSSSTQWLTRRISDVYQVYSKDLKVAGDVTVGSGRIVIRINRDVALAGFYDRAVMVFFTGIVRNMLLVFLLYLAYYFVITKPLNIFVRKISSIDPENPGENPVEIPKSHENDELGWLARTFNGFSNSIVSQFRRLKKTQDELSFARDELIKELEAHKETAEHLMEMRLQADNANRAKSAFLANMSHELRTPLNAIIGFASLMSSEAKGPIGNKDYLGYLHDIEEAGTKLTDLLGQLLDLSRIESGEMELKESIFPLNELIESSLLIFQSDFEDRKLILTKEIDANLGEINADRRRLRQVLMNLISNAIKFSHEGGEIILSAKIDKDGSALISLRDFGIGISEEIIPQMLEPFVQAEIKYNKSFQGAGLGLSLSSLLVKLHGGKVWIESEEGNGTSVYVRLPEKRLAGLSEMS